MTISHPYKIAADSKELFVFAALLDLTCSICAPKEFKAEQIEAFASDEIKGGPAHDHWRAIDKAKELGIGSPTPNPCNQAPDKRLHWFLLSEPK